MARNLISNPGYIHLIPSFLILLLGQFHPSTQFSNETVRLSLLAFKDQTYDPYDALTSWNDSLPFCAWAGVTCTPINNSVERVTALQLPGMDLQGILSPHIANLSFLSVLDLQYNGFYGTLPSELGLLHQLKVLNVTGNHLEGTIPANISQCEELRGLYLSDNSFTGTIPDELGLLRNLVMLHLNGNSLTGSIPHELGSLIHLKWLDLQRNLLTGIIPSSIFNISSLTRLDLGQNRLTGHIPQELGNLSSLLYLGLDDNDFGGNVPASIRGLQNLVRLNLTKIREEGPIPTEIFSLGKLEELYLGENMLFGSIPESISNLTRLRALSLAANRLSSRVPSTLWRLENLTELNLSWNSLLGPLPPQVDNLKAVRTMDLSSNNFSDDLPEAFGNVQSLRYLDLSGNSFIGPIPNSLSQLVNITHMDFSSNNFSDNIPEALGNLQSLSHLDLSRNSFIGSIPNSFSQLVRIQYMDLSSNNLSGSIPKSLERLGYTLYLNFAFNKFEGEIPSGGPFANLMAQSFMGNLALCGSPKFQVPPCGFGDMKTVKSGEAKAVKIGDAKISFDEAKTVEIVVPIIGFILLSRICVTELMIRRAKKVENPAAFDTPEMGQMRMVTIRELQHATNNFSTDNLLGAGSFSTVYRGTLDDGTDIAVKVLKLQLEGALESFDAECQVLRSVRHKNLAKVITACSNLDFKALVLEFMRNGSLDQWLHSDHRCLGLIRRLDIMIDVAFAMEYLHHGFWVPIVHCDLKPSNVLLDDEMMALVSDFGIAKLLACDGFDTQTMTLGTTGYIAPEYGLDGRVSTKADVYSYGILLLETFTRKKPTDEMFTGDSNLHRWVRDAFPDAVTKVVDDNLLMELDHICKIRARVEEDKENRVAVEQLVAQIFHVGLSCARESPDERCTMRDVVVKLKKIRMRLGTFDL